MTTPLLSDLREPPVVGRYYMVPVIKYVWHGRWDHWPVLGPLHTDADHFNFPHRHYHVDVRFLSKTRIRWAAKRAGVFRLHDEDWAATVANAATVATWNPLFHFAHPHRRGRPGLQRLMCRVDALPFVLGGNKLMQALHAAYPDPAPAIARPDGRLLCPHRKVDLSSFAPDADGIVTCPLHGLRVQCAKVAA